MVCFWWGVAQESSYQSSISKSRYRSNKDRLDLSFMQVSSKERFYRMNGDLLKVKSLDLDLIKLKKECRRINNKVLEISKMQRLRLMIILCMKLSIINWPKVRCCQDYTGTIISLHFHIRAYTNYIRNPADILKKFVLTINPTIYMVG